MTMIRKKELTKKQHQLISFLRETIRDQEYWPTLTEMQAHFGYKSLNSISQLLEALVNKHYLKKGNRRYYFKDETDEPVSVPMYAGNGALGEQRFFRMRPVWRDLDGLSAIPVRKQNEGFAGLNQGDFLLVSEMGIRDNCHVVYRYDAKILIGRYGKTSTSFVTIDDNELSTKEVNVLGRY